MEVHPLNSTLREIIQRLMSEAGAYWIQPEDAVSHATMRTLICATLLEAVRQIHSPSRKPDQIVAAAMTCLNEHYQEPMSVAKLG